MRCAYRRCISFDAPRLLQRNERHAVLHGPAHGSHNLGTFFRHAKRQPASRLGNGERSHWRGSHVLSPCLNHRIRCAEVPSVEAARLPLVKGKPSSKSPGSSTLRFCMKWAQIPV